MLGKLKWRKSCSGFRSRRAGLWPASDLPGHCLDSVPAHKHSNSGDADEKGSGSWNFWALRVWPPPWGLMTSYDSQGETNSIVKRCRQNQTAYLHTNWCYQCGTCGFKWGRTPQTAICSLAGWVGTPPGPLPGWGSRLLFMRDFPAQLKSGCRLT